MENVCSKTATTGLMTNVSHANKDLDWITGLALTQIQFHANDLILYFCVFPIFYFRKKKVNKKYCDFFLVQQWYCLKKILIKNFTFFFYI